MIGFSRTHRARRRLILSCGAIPMLVVALLTLYRPDAFTRAERALYDVMLRSIPTTRPSSQVVVVDVDERSLSAVGQWPWRRDVVARLTERLRALGARVVALDIIFAEPDRDATSTKGDPDRALAAAVGKGDVILGYGLTFDGPRGSASTCVLHPAPVAILHQEGDAADEPLFEATGAICSLPALAESAGASGFLNAVPDADGILRRAPLLVRYDGRIYPSLALASVAAFNRSEHLSLTVTNRNAAALALDDRIVPVDGRGNLLLRYRGKKNTFAYVSAADVLAGKVSDHQVRDKIVFVGTTALGTREVVATPLDTLFVGVEVQATIADNLLQQDFLWRPSSAVPLELLLVITFGAIVACLLLWGGPLAGLCGAVGSVAVLWFGIVWHVSVRGSFISPLSPALSAALALAAMTLASVFAERRRADTATLEKTTAQQLMVQSLLSLTETRDEETGRHSLRTRRYTRLLAEQLSRHPAYRAYLTPERIDLLSSLAPLHDIGKVGIPDHILNKPGALTPEELAQMRRHPELGRDVIVKAEKQVGVHDDAILAMAKDLVYTHHERWDGTGYPQGLRGPQIPVPGRLLAIVDVYDAVVERSLYQRPMSHEDAVQFIRRGSGTHFDPDVVEAFMGVAPEFERLFNQVGSPT